MVAWRYLGLHAEAELPWGLRPYAGRTLMVAGDLHRGVWIRPVEGAWVNTLEVKVGLEGEKPQLEVELRHWVPVAQINLVLP